jgi:hypothetical protein
VEMLITAIRQELPSGPTDDIDGSHQARNT